MTAVAFDTLKFARALREKAKLSPEQAEGLADALVDVFDGNLATKADIRDVQADLQVVRGDVEALKIQTRADIEALRLSTKADIEAVKGAIASAKVEMVRWLVGAIGFQTLAVLGAVVALTRTLH
jgi:multidrug resistance efflux pump